MSQPTTKKATIALLEDKPQGVAAFEMLLNTDDRFEIVNIFNTIPEALSELPRIKPSAVLIDIVFPEDASGIDALKQLRKDLPESFLIMLTAYDDPEYLFESFLSGADGYLLKSDPPQRLLQELGTIFEGGAPMTRSIARRVLQFFRRLPHHFPIESDLASLSRRECEILELIARGYSAKEVAQKLGISTFTVTTHQKRIYKKLHVNSGLAAASKYLKSKTRFSKLFN